MQLICLVLFIVTSKIYIYNLFNFFWRAVDIKYHCVVYVC